MAEKRLNLEKLIESLKKEFKEDNKIPTLNLPKVLPPLEQLKELKELTEKLIDLHHLYEETLLCEKYSKK